jgi:sensor histidine kinase YesM
MNSSKRRIVSIVSELICNSLDAGATDISVSINRNSEKFEITVKDNGSGMDEKTLKEVKRILNQPLKEVYEEYYSALAGNTYTDSGLNIVGFQVDKAEVESSPNKGTTIKVSRNL